MLIDIYLSNSNKIKLKKFNQKKIDFVKLNNALEIETWDKVYYEKDVNKAFYDWR